MRKIKRVKNVLIFLYFTCGHLNMALPGNFSGLINIGSLFI